MLLGFDPFGRNSAPRAVQPVRRRNDGFSDDGLSYSVADDYSKLAGQAMAEYDARIKDPRYVPGGATPHPDSPELLDAELFAPIRERFGLNSRRTTAPKTYEIGNELVSLDPNTGKTNVVYSAPAKAAPEMSPRQKLEYGDLLGQRRALMGKSFLMNEDRDKLSELDTQIKAFGSHPEASANPAVQPPKEPLWPGGNVVGSLENNLFESPTPSTPKTTDDLISVVNPKGKPVKIRASQLEQALKSGYKRR